jgi:hypothetical protein
MRTLEFLSTLNGQIYSSIEEIVVNQGKGISIWLRGEKDCLCFNNECNFFLTQEGLKVKDGGYTTFIRFEEIRTIRKF